MKYPPLAIIQLSYKEKLTNLREMHFSKNFVDKYRGFVHDLVEFQKFLALWKLVYIDMYYGNIVVDKSEYPKVMDFGHVVHEDDVHKTLKKYFQARNYIYLPPIIYNGLLLVSNVKQYSLIHSRFYDFDIDDDIIMRAMDDWEFHDFYRYFGTFSLLLKIPEKYDDGFRAIHEEEITDYIIREYPVKKIQFLRKYVNPSFETKYTYDL